MEHDERAAKADSFKAMKTGNVVGRKRSQQYALKASRLKRDLAFKNKE